MIPKPKTFLIAIAGCAIATSALGTTATSLSSFQGQENPTRKYNDERNRYENHGSSGHIEHKGNGLFQFNLHYRPNKWWCSDTANVGNNDDKTRSRAEVKGLGALQKGNQTFQYESRWRTKSGFKASGKFCHIFQLKANDGAHKGFPMITQSLTSSKVKIKVSIGTNTSSTEVRNVGYTKSEFKTTQIRVKTSTQNKGWIKTKFSGESSFKTAFNNTNMGRTGSTEYRPKWGFYRRSGEDAPLRDDYIQHKQVKSNKL